MREKRIQINGQDTPYLVRDDGTVWSELRKRVLKGTIDTHDYPVVFLSQNGITRNYLVHRLVAEAFVPNPNNYNVVHHKDNNKLNAAANNLEWVTMSENVKAAIPTRKKATNNQKYNGDYTDANWKIITDFPDYSICEDGRVVNNQTRNILVPGDRNGYKRVQLRVNGKTSIRSLHRLLYEAFIGPIPQDMVIDHIDGNKANNNLSNLRLVSQSDNMKNAMKNGHKGQIPILQFDLQGNFIKEFSTIQAAADSVNVTYAAVRTAAHRNGTSAGYRWKIKS